MNETLTRIALIARREYLQRVRTKTFAITTLVTPAIMLGFMFLPDFFMNMKTGEVKSFVVVSDDSALAQRFQQQLSKSKRGRFNISIDQSTTPAERRKLDAQVRAREIDGYLWLTREAMANSKVDFCAGSTSNFLETEQIRQATTVVAVAYRLQLRGIQNLDTASLLHEVEVRVIQVGGAGASQEAVFSSATLLVLVLYMTVALHGVAVMRSVLEEKTSRVLEVMLSAVSPTELMAGKILGVGALGLTQIAIWTAVALALSVGGIVALGHSLYFTPTIGIFFVVFYVLGFLLYSALGAALGAMVNSEEESQQLQFFLVMPIIFALMLIGVVLNDPNSAASVAVSEFPLFAPVLMYLRVILEQPPAWQVALCIAILLASIYGMLMASARIYRVGILMYGKRPTLPEILKWLHQA